jgi:hypothetical protein
MASRQSLSISPAGRGRAAGKGRPRAESSALIIGKPVLLSLYYYNRQACTTAFIIGKPVLLRKGFNVELNHGVDPASQDKQGDLFVFGNRHACATGDKKPVGD